MCLLFEDISARFVFICSVYCYCYGNIGKYLVVCTVCELLNLIRQYACMALESSL